MKAIVKIVAFAACFMTISTSQTVIAASETNLSSADLVISIGEMKVSEFIKLSVKDFSSLTGKKMNLKEKLSFSFLKKDMKKSLRSVPVQNVKDYLADTGNKKSGEIIILIVFVLAVIGAIILSSLPIF